MGDFRRKPLHCGASKAKFFSSFLEPYSRSNHDYSRRETYPTAHGLTPREFTAICTAKQARTLDLATLRHRRFPLLESEGPTLGTAYWPEDEYRQLSRQRL